MWIDYLACGRTYAFVRIDRCREEGAQAPRSRARPTFDATLGAASERGYRMSESVSDGLNAAWAPGAEELPVQLSNVFSVKATPSGVVLTIGFVVMPVSNDSDSTSALIAHPLSRTVFNPAVARSLGDTLIQFAMQVEEKFADVWSPPRA